jgi:hypothetical protein
MKSLLSLGLAMGLLLAAVEPAAAFRPGSRPRPRPPQQQPAFAALANLDASTCSALETMLTHPMVIKNIKAARKAGAQLRKITPLPRTSSEDQKVEFTFDKVGNPFGPPTMAIPYHASFTVHMFLPQDAGWQMGEVSPLREVQ